MYHPGFNINGPCPDPWHIANAVIDVDEAGPGVVSAPHPGMLAKIGWGDTFVVVDVFGTSYHEVLTQDETTRQYVHSGDDPYLTPGSVFVDPLIPTWSYFEGQPDKRVLSSVHVENLRPISRAEFEQARLRGWVPPDHLRHQRI